MSNPDGGEAYGRTPAEAGGGNVCIRQSAIEGAGRGVFATRRIPRGEIVSTCHYVELATPDHAVETLKETGVYWWAFKCRDGRTDRMTFALGELTLVNHADTPNVRIVEDRRARTLSAVAVCDIEPGDEILHAYLNASEYNFARYGGPSRRDSRRESEGRK